MNRAATLLIGLALVAPAAPAVAAPLSTVTVLSPVGSARAQALLVLLPDAAETGTALLTAARAAQAEAQGLRLWVAVADLGLGPAGAAEQVAQARAAVGARGFSPSDGEVVVAGWGRAGAAGAEQAGHALGATAGLADDGAATDLRVLAELDRGVRVVAAVAGRSDRALVLPAATSADLRGRAAGAALGDLVLAARGRPDRLDARLAADRLVTAVDGARVAERGAACTSLQLHTADADPTLLSVTDRSSADLMAPTPDGVAAGDLGGFLYDKAELVDEGGTVRLVTNSYVVGGSPAYELMCKTKSRSAVAQALTGDHTSVDDTPPTCAGFTEATLEAARSAVSPAAAARSGGVTVLPDLAKSAGPEWVFSPLVQRPADPVTGRWEVQSPALLTELSDTELDPEFAGNHYCKVLSPLRALELVLDDTAPAT